MIKTKKICDDPLIIHHKVYSFSNAQETINDVKETIDIIKKSLMNDGTFNLLMDFSALNGESNYDMAAHKKWALGFKENIEINKHMRNVAVFGKDSSKFRAEKECMEDTSHRWFTNYDEALRWLKMGNF